MYRFCKSQLQFLTEREILYRPGYFHLFLHQCNNYIIAQLQSHVDKMETEKIDFFKKLYLFRVSSGVYKNF